MSELFKELKDFFGDRVRTPPLWSYAWAVLVLNWQPFYYLFYADKTVPERLDFFNDHTSAYSLVLCPVLLALALILGIPYLRLWLSRGVSSAIKWHRDLEDIAAHERRISGIQREISETEERTKAVKAVAELERASEELLQLRTDDEPVSELDLGGFDDFEDVEAFEAFEAFEADGATGQTEKQFPSLSENAINHLMQLAKTPEGAVKLKERFGNENGELKYQILGTNRVTSNNRAFSDFETAIKELVAAGLLVNEGGNVWRINSAGYEFVESNSLL